MQPKQYFFVFILLIIFNLTFTNKIFAYVNNQAALGTLGQNDLTSGSPNKGTSVGSSGFYTSESGDSRGKMTFTNTALILADTYNNRVLIWNTSDGLTEDADIVLGQEDFTHNSANRGGSADADTLNHPNSAYFDGEHFIVADTGNNRILIWNEIPTTNGQAADIVLGQPNFEETLANAGSPTAIEYTVNRPTSVFSDGSNLAVSDAGNNRVLIWSPFPTDTDPANAVYGQEDFVSNECNRGSTPDSNTLCNPMSVQIIFGSLLIADTDNNRALIWTNPESADYAFGQNTFTENLPNKGGLAGSDTLNHPHDITISSEAGAVSISDTGNNRILIWEDIFEPGASAVLGQRDFSHVLANKGGPVTIHSLSSPTSSMVFGDVGIFVLDSGNNRINIYLNTDDTSYGDEEDIIDEDEEDIIDDFIKRNDNSKTKDKKCVAPRPLPTNKIKVSPAKVDGVSGMQLTWVQYMADKITIKIDDGTGTFPWQIEKSTNDGHEFLPNVGPTQKIMITPYNDCKSGTSSLPVSYSSHRLGWYN